MTIDRETVIRFAKKARLPSAWFSDTAIPDLERFAALVLGHGRKPLCWLQQDKFGNFHAADESWHGAFPVYGEPKV